MLQVYFHSFFLPVSVFRVFHAFVCHFVRLQFELILAAYRAESKQSKGTLAALKEVRARGRKRVMLG